MDLYKSGRFLFARPFSFKIGFPGEICTHAHAGNYFMHQYFFISGKFRIAPAIEQSQVFSELTL